MLIPLRQLDNSLNKKLLPIYCIHGDTPLLLQEAVDKIYKKAVEEKFTPQKLYVEKERDWEKVLEEIKALNLFQPKTLLIVKLDTIKIPSSLEKIFAQPLPQKPLQKILVIISQKIKKSDEKKSWYQNILKTGAIVPIYPPSGNERRQWIYQKLKTVNLKIDNQAIVILEELTTGNLLATSQAIEKLALLYPNEMIDQQKILSVTCDHAHFSIFDFPQEMLAGELKKALRILQNLKATGTEMTLLLWAITRQIRELIKLAEKLTQGCSIATLLASKWRSSHTFFKRALSKFSKEELERLLQHCAKIDRIIKGEGVDDPWRAFENLLISCYRSQSLCAEL